MNVSKKNGVERCIDCRYCPDGFCTTYRVSVVGDEKNPHCLMGRPKTTFLDRPYFPIPGSFSSFVTYRETEPLMEDMTPANQGKNLPQKVSKRKKGS